MGPAVDAVLGLQEGVYGDEKTLFCFLVRVLAPLLYSIISASQPGTKVKSPPTIFTVFFH